MPGFSRHSVEAERWTPFRSHYGPPEPGVHHHRVFRTPGPDRRPVGCGRLLDVLAQRERTRRDDRALGQRVQGGGVLHVSPNESGQSAVHLVIAAVGPA
ncbi:hypothetical protein ACWEV4_23250 [Streptomyces sp. NPDC003860]